MEKFDPEQAAKEAIATSPDVTPGVNFINVDDGNEGDGQAIKGDVEGFDYIPCKRNGRLAGIALKSWDVDKKRFHKEQVEATEEVSAEIFGALNAAPIPNIYKVAVTFLLLILTFIPTILGIYGAYQEGDDNGAD